MPEQAEPRDVSPPLLIGKLSYKVIWSPAIMHPDTDDTILAWKAPKTGNVRLFGNPRKQDVGGDGVNVKIQVNSQSIWPSVGWKTIDAYDTNGVSYDMNIAVNKNDIIYFILNKNQNNANDATYWNPQIKYQ